MVVGSFIKIRAHGMKRLEQLLIVLKVSPDGSINFVPHRVLLCRNKVFDFLFLFIIISFYRRLCLCRRYIKYLDCLCCSKDLKIFGGSVIDLMPFKQRFLPPPLLGQYKLDEYIHRSDYRE